MIYKLKALKKLSIAVFACALLFHAIVPAEIDSSYCGRYSSNTEVFSVGNMNMHHLGNSAVSGATNYSGDFISYEGFYGLKAQTSKTGINYTMYSHCRTYCKGIVTIQPYGDSSNAIILGEIKAAESASVDMCSITQSMQKCSIPGIYTLSIAVNDEKPIPIFLYYDGHSVKTCRYDRTTLEDIEAWNRVISNVNPEDCLGMYVLNKNVPITYPTSGQNGNCNHVQEWCDISDQIILNDNWSDETKVFAFVLYLTRNCAYDDWRVFTNDNKSRATLSGRWDDASLWTLENKVGTCWDMANIMTIMCRHHGIPCTSVENSHHTVNAIWLRGEWVAIDVSSLLQHHCYTEDTDPDGWIYRRDGSWSSYYGYYDYMMDTYNQALATPETTLSTRSGKNPM